MQRIQTLLFTLALEVIFKPQDQEEGIAIIYNLNNQCNETKSMDSDK